MGAGEVVRCRYVLPSDSVIICVKVYGRLGRRSSEAWRICVVRRQEGQLGRSEVVRREDIVVVVGGIFFCVVVV